MKRVITFIFVILAVVGFSQNKSLSEYQQLALAKDVNGENVIFSFIPMPGKDDEWNMIRDSPLFMTNIDNHVEVYDCRTKEMVHSFELRPKDVLINVTDEGYLIGRDAGYIWSVDHPYFYGFDGNKLWDIKKMPFIFDRVNHVMMLGHQTYEAIDMVSGEKLWKKKISDENHLWANDNLVSKSNPEYRYFIADSLIKINMRTGEYRSRPFKAGAKMSFKKWLQSPRPEVPSDVIRNEAFHSTPEFAYTGGHFYLMPLTGIGYVPMHIGQFNDRFTGTHSNWIERGDTLLIADRDSLYCLDRDLNSYWAAPFPKDVGGFSTIKLKNDKIYVLNYGIAFSDGKPCNYRKPFAATYDVNTGKQLSVTIPDFAKKVQGGQYCESGRIYLQGGDKFYYCYEGDSVATQIKWKPKTKYKPDPRHPDFMICDTVYTYSNGVLNPVVTDNDKLIVEVYGKDVFVISPDGNAQMIPASEVYFHEGKGIYSSNEKSPSMPGYIVKNPETDEILFTTSAQGPVIRDEYGNVYVKTKQGLGFWSPSE